MAEEMVKGTRTSEEIRKDITTTLAELNLKRKEVLELNDELALLEYDRMVEERFIREETDWKKYNITNEEGRRNHIRTEMKTQMDEIERVKKSIDDLKDMIKSLSEWRSFLMLEFKESIVLLELQKQQ